MKCNHIAANQGQKLFQSTHKSLYQQHQIPGHQELYNLQPTSKHNFLNTFI